MLGAARVRPRSPQYRLDIGAPWVSQRQCPSVASPSAPDRRASFCNELFRARIKLGVVPGALGSSSSSGGERFALAARACGGLDPAELVWRSTGSAQFGIGPVRDRLSSGSAQFEIGSVPRDQGLRGWDGRLSDTQPAWPPSGPSHPLAPRAPGRDAHSDFVLQEHGRCRFGDDRVAVAGNGQGTSRAACTP